MSKKIKLFVYIFSVLALAVAVASVVFSWQVEKDTPDPRNLLARTPVFEDEPAHSSYSMDKGFYDIFFQEQNPKPKVKEQVYSAVVPHHLIAGQHIGSFFNSLSKQKPDTVVIIGPNHKQLGNSGIIVSDLSWNTPYGLVENDDKLLKKILQNEQVTIDRQTMGWEHSISGLVPFIKNTWPRARVLPIILKNNAENSDIDTLVAELAKEKDDILVLVSVDFSHYLPKVVADFHDKLSSNTLASGNLQSLPALEVDSQPSLYALLRYNKLVGAQKFAEFSHTNSSDFVGADVAESTSHIIGYYVSGEPDKKPIASLQFFGDIMLDRNVAKAMGKDGLDYLFANLRGGEDRFFQGMHMLVANLEGPFAPARVPTTKSIAFRFDPALAAQLKKYGFDGFNLANNHSYDMSRKNVDFTRETLAKNNLFYFGDEYNQGTEYTYIAGEKEGLPFTVAFIGFNDTEHSLDVSKVKTVIEDAKNKAKYVIVNIHWGQEYQQKSNERQQILAHQMIDWGADAIIGHHPHVVEEMERYNGKPIFYSLGNFIFDQYFSKETQEGISVGLTVGEEGIDWTVIPLFSAKSQVQVMTGERKDKFFNWFYQASPLEDQSY